MRSYSTLRDRTGPLPFVLSPLTSHNITEVKRDRPVLVILIAAALFAMIAGPVLLHGGAVDHETRAVVEVVR